MEETTDWLSQRHPCQNDDYFKITGSADNVLLLGFIDGAEQCPFGETFNNISFKEIDPRIYQVVMCCGLERRVFNRGDGVQETWYLKQASGERLIFNVSKVYNEEVYDVEITFQVR